MEEEADFSLLTTLKSSFDLYSTYHFDYVLTGHSVGILEITDTVLVTTHQLIYIIILGQRPQDPSTIIQNWLIESSVF